MLANILATNVYALLVIFVRLGGAMMMFPGLNSALVAVRIRLLLAVSIAFLLLPSLAGRLPPMPPDPMSMSLLIASEATIGLFLGIVMQVLVLPIDMAGNSISYALGLTNMFTNDIITQQQGQLVAGFLNMLAIAMIFLTDTHHLMFQAVVDSYSLFPPGQSIPFGDISEVLVRKSTESMVMGFKLASPAIVFAITFNTALALLNRLVPHVQVFFVGVPVQILGGLGILSFALPAIMIWFLRYYSDGLQAFLAPG